MVRRMGPAAAQFVLAIPQQQRQQAREAPDWFRMGPGLKLRTQGQAQFLKVRVFGCAVQALILIQKALGHLERPKFRLVEHFGLSL